MDLATLDPAGASEGAATCTLRHPVTQEELSVTITVMGMESHTALSHQRAQIKKRMGRGGGKSYTMEQMESDSIELAARLTTGWTGVEWQGNDLPFTTENARMLYRERPWVRRQVETFVNDLGNYLGNSASSSSPSPSSTGE